VTLVLNEIHLIEGLKRTFLIAAADRRLTRPDGSRYGAHPKLFEIPYLNGAVSYFGLAEFRRAGKPVRLWDFLPAFVRSHATLPDLGAFSVALRDELERAIPKRTLKEHPLGFHLCGYGRTGLPDFWWLTNVRTIDDAGRITEWKDTFKAPGSHFLGRDAPGLFGWDGSDPLSARSGAFMLYRNGDIQVHVQAADLLNKMFDRLLDLPAVKRPRTAAEFKQYARYKFKFIVGLHKTWLKSSTVGEGPDLLMWSANDGRVTKVP